MKATPVGRVTPPLRFTRRLHGELSPRLTGLPYLADRATRLGLEIQFSHTVLVLTFILREDFVEC